ncbi:MAG: DUF3316 domain-containing protein [Bacteroidaceae bacterium]|nr:DUF3316 domain-containing protein [Bacteroidaceae bacterium]
MKLITTLITLCLLTAVLPLGTSAQDAINRNSTHVTQLGIGGVNQLDTYLSPLEYDGWQAHYMHQTLRPTHWFQNRLSFQQMTHCEISITHNQPKKSNYMGGSVSYDAAWHYSWKPLPTLRLMAGPQAGGNVGFLYNTRNGNNPAQALANVHLAASVAAIFHFQLWHQTFTLSDQADIPIIGAMFTPNYGQSYYEIFSEGNTDHNVCVTSPFNAPTLRNQFSLDFPLLGYTVRATYLMDIRQSHVNEIKHHSYSHAFLLGWVKHFTYKKRTQALEDGFIL